MPNTDIKLLRDELAKVIGTVRKHERTIRQQGDQLVRLALERDRAILEMETVRAENEDLRARLAEYGQVPSRRTTTSTRRPVQEDHHPEGDQRPEEGGAEKGQPRRQARPAQGAQGSVGEPEGG